MRIINYSRRFLKLGGEFFIICVGSLARENEVYIICVGPYAWDASYTLSAWGLKL